MGSMPLRISSELVAKARAEAELSDRSVTAQVEHWVKLGMALEEILSTREVRALKQSGAAALDAALLQPQSPEGQARAVAHLAGKGTPRYGTDPAFPGRIVRVTPDGVKTPGRFENRVFVPDEH